MRHTSPRRRSGGFAQAHITGAGKPASKPPTMITLEPDDPDATVCSECGAIVLLLKNGRPRAHARGGEVPNTRRGLYKCAGSGRE